MRTKQSVSLSLLAISLVASFGLVGCNDVNTPPGSSAAAPGGKMAEFKADVDAGVPATFDTNPDRIKKEVTNRAYSGRPDPFALLAVERKFEKMQQAERLVGESGWSVQFEPPVPTEAQDIPDELQPYRRLAGVIVGDTVLAILIMEDGHSEIIRPGMMVPNTEWRVVSITEETAVLRRAGNRRPHQITIPLEQDRNGFGGGGGGNQGGNPGGNPRGGAGDPRGGGGGRDGE